MSIADYGFGPRAITELAKEEIADIIVKGINELLEDELSDRDIFENNELKKQRDRVLKFMGYKLVDSKVAKL